MNIWNAVKNAEECFKNGQTEEAINCLRLAEKILEKADAEKKNNHPFICCFYFSKGIIHCGKNDEEVLFEGTWDERVVSCKKCRDSCREKIKKLKAEFVS